MDRLWHSIPVLQDSSISLLSDHVIGTAARGGQFPFTSLVKRTKYPNMLTVLRSMARQAESVSIPVVQGNCNGYLPVGAAAFTAGGDALKTLLVHRGGTTHSAGTDGAAADHAAKAAGPQLPPVLGVDAGAAAAPVVARLRHVGARESRAHLQCMRALRHYTSPQSDGGVL